MHLAPAKAIADRCPAVGVLRVYAKKVKRTIEAFFSGQSWRTDKRSISASLRRMELTFMRLNTERFWVRGIAIVWIIVVFVGVCVGSVTAGSQTSPSGEYVLLGPFDKLAPSETVAEITTDRTGRAHWRIEYRYRLENETQRRAFERASRELTNPPGEFIERQKRVVAFAENTTGRSMRVVNASVETETSPAPVDEATIGVVRYRFEWTNFAAEPVQGRLVVGADVLAGFELQDNQTLQMEWGDELRRQSVVPDPDLNQTYAVSWTGPATFDTPPTVELASTGNEARLPVSPAAVGIGVVSVLTVGAIAGSLWRRRSTSGVDTGADDELLSDEERVIRLLEARGGRMKQQELIDEVAWSRGKVSDVVNEMHETGQIDVFRLGRENVLALPGEIDV